MIRKFIQKLSNKKDIKVTNTNKAVAIGREPYIVDRIKKYISRLTEDLNTYHHDSYSTMPFYELRDLMYSDSQVTSLWNTRLTSLSIPYRISKNNSDDKVFEFTKYQFLSLDTYMISKLMINAVAFGFSALELTWRLAKFNERLFLLLNELDFILNEKISFKNGDIYYQGYKKTNPTLLHPFKVLLLKNGKEHGDMGFPLFFPIWKEYKKKELIDFYHLNFIEKLTGVLYLIKAKNLERTEGTGEEDNNEDEEMLNAVTGLENTYTLLLDSTKYELELKELAQKSSTNETFLKAKTYCDEQIAKVILGQTLTTESGTTGSYALGKTHEGVRIDYATADRMFCEAGFNELIKKIIDLNFGIQSNYPEFIFKTKNLERDTLLTKNLRVKFSKEYIRENYGLNENDFEIDIKEGK